MRAKRVPSKDPDDLLDYWITYAPTDGDTIVSASWDVPDGLTSSDEEVTAERATVWITGGTAGTEYLFTGRIVTTMGRTIDQSFKLYVEEH